MDTQAEVTLTFVSRYKAKHRGFRSHANVSFGPKAEFILGFGNGNYRTKAVNFYSDAANLSYIEVSSFVLRYKVHQL